MSETVTREDTPNQSTRPTSQKVSWVNRNLAVAFPGLLPPSPPTGPAKAPTDGDFVNMQKARIIWDNLRKSIQAQLRSLEAAMIKAVQIHNADPKSEEGFDPDEVAKAADRLYLILDGLDVRLINTLDAALSADGTQRLKLQQAAKDIIKEYQAFVAADKNIQSVDFNGFIQTAIRSSVEKTLTALAQTL